MLGRMGEGSPRAEPGCLTRCVRPSEFATTVIGPSNLGGPEVSAFLTHLASDRTVAAATQHQALAALLFLYKQVLEIELPWLDQIVRSKRPKRLPVVLTRAEVRAVLGKLTGCHWLVAGLLYGSGPA